MKKKALFLSGLLFLASTLVFAQGGKLTFEKSTHDFGTVKEEGGPVSVEFKFTNTGTGPILISDVQPSCGCTTPDWTKTPVAPGKSGIIKAEYNPLNRPGTFAKTLSVTSNGEPSTLVLNIKGAVTPKAKTPADDYPDKIGAIRMQSRYLNFGKVTTEKPVTKTFDIYNDGEKPVSFKDEMTLPSYIKASIAPKTVAPKQKAVLTVTYDAKAKNDLGYIADPIVINTTEENGKKDLHITATIEEYFAPMTPSQLANAPKLTFQKMEHDFGSLKQGVSSTFDFVFTNTGKSDLLIRKTKANCGCTASEPDKKQLKPGESSKIVVTFNTTGKEGSQIKEVAIYSNDPTAPTQTLKIKANIAKGES